MNRDLFAVPGYARWLVARSVSWFGDTVMVLVLSMWVKTLTDSNSRAGITMAFFMAPQLAAPLGGFLVDRLSRHRVLVGGNLVSAAALAPLWGVRGADDVWVIWACTVAYGLSGVVLSAASGALQRAITPDDLLPAAQSTQQLVGTTFQLLAPLVGAGLFATHGGRGPSALAIGCFVAGSVLFTGFPEGARAAEPNRGSVWHEMTAGLRHIHSSEALWHALVAMLIVQSTAGLLEGSMYSVTDTFGRGAAWVGTIATAQGIGMVVGALCAGWVVVRLGEARAMTAGFSIVAVLVVVCAAAPNLTSYLALLVLIGFFLPWIFVAFGTLQQRLTPEQLMGRVGTAMAPLFSLASVGSMTIGALLVSMWSFRQIYPVVAAGLATAAIYLHRQRPRGEPGVSLGRGTRTAPG